MHRPNAFGLTNATAGQLRSLFDGLTGSTKCDDPLVGSYVGNAASVFFGCLGNLDTLALPVSSGLVIFARHLQS